MSRLVTMSTRSGGTIGCRRPTVSSSNDRPVTSANSGLGRSGVLSGQNRDPMPPANTTAQRVSPVAGASAGSMSGNSSVAGPLEAGEEPGEVPRVGAEILIAR